MKKLFGLIIAFFFHLNVYSQGCSDAGFCTMGTMAPNQEVAKENLSLRSVELSYYNGKTNITPVVRSITLDGVVFYKGINFQGKILVQQAFKGNLGSPKLRLGDLSLSASKPIITGNGYTLNATVGLKISAGKGDLKDDLGRTFPMYYQPNLGSHDVIFGTALITEKWMIATGGQIPVLNFNENDFTYEMWKDYPSQSYLRNHSLANNLKRGTDVMLRIERDFRLSKFNVNIGLLNIYRVNKDQLLDAESNEYVKVDKTTGLASTVLAGLQYKFNVSSSIKLGYGLKLVDREVNPDGLTREYVFTIGYLIKF